MIGPLYIIAITVKSSGSSCLSFNHSYLCFSSSTPSTVDSILQSDLVKQIKTRTEEYRTWEAWEWMIEVVRTVTSCRIGVWRTKNIKNRTSSFRGEAMHIPSIGRVEYRSVTRCREVWIHFHFRQTSIRTRLYIWSTKTIKHQIPVTSTNVFGFDNLRGESATQS